MRNKKSLNIFLLLLVSFIVSACSPQVSEWKNHLLKSEVKVSEQLKRLALHIEKDNIRNAKLLKKYADKLRNQKPEFTGIIDLIVEDAGTKGPIYKGLLSRFETAKNSAKIAHEEGFASVKAVDQEFSAIFRAASPTQFNNMLIDPINTLASMSGGTLATLKVDGLEEPKGDRSPGSNLVGNPHYGRWETDSSGSAFWAFYGQYAFFSSMFRGSIYYDRWSSGRSSSYYHDRGRGYYTSPSQRKIQDTVQWRTEKKFARLGKAFKSPYANNSIKNSVRKSPSKFQSSYGHRSFLSNTSSDQSRPTRINYNSRSSFYRSSGRGGK